MFIISGIGIPDYASLIVILVIVLILFGPKNLPKIGGAIGRSIREFKDGLSNLGGDENEEVEDKRKKAVQPMKRERSEALPGNGESSAAKSSAPIESETSTKND